MNVKLIKSGFLFLFFNLAFSLLGQVDLGWDAHGIGFTVPDDFEVYANDIEEFSAGNDNVYLTLLPWQDASVDETGLAEAVFEVAYNMEYDQISEATNASVDDFVGYGVSGTKDGVWAVIVMLLDVESETNLVVVITYNYGYQSTAQAIYDSLYAYD